MLKAEIWLQKWNRIWERPQNPVMCSPSCPSLLLSTLFPMALLHLRIPPASPRGCHIWWGPGWAGRVGGSGWGGSAGFLLWDCRVNFCMDSCLLETSGKSGQSRLVLTCRWDEHFPLLHQENPRHVFPLPFSFKSNKAKRSQEGDSPTMHYWRRKYFFLNLPINLSVTGVGLGLTPVPVVVRPGKRGPSPSRRWVSSPLSPRHLREMGLSRQARANGAEWQLPGHGYRQPMKHRQKKEKEGWTIEQRNGEKREERQDGE